MSNREKTVKIHIDLTEKPERWPPVTAYLMTRTGKLIAKQKLKPETEAVAVAEFKVDPRHRDLVLKIGPTVDEPHMLPKHRPYVKSIEVAEELVLELPKKIWICWVKAPYVVTGTVKKPVSGKHEPICAGEVEIYDVDLKPCLMKLPDPIIERIRDGIIDVIVDPPPIDPKLMRRVNELTWPQPDDDDWCGTKPKPPIPPRAVDVRKKLETLPKEWSFALEKYDRLPEAKTRVNMKLKELPMRERTMLLNSNVMKNVSFNQIVYSNTKQFRELLVANLYYFKYWLCWWPWIYWLWWPYCGSSLEHLGTATLNPDGSFHKTIWLSVCRNDIPDLWLRVVQKINGVEKVIYARHPIPCNTYWNHPSGDPVDLLVTHPDAVVCHEPEPAIPDPYVMPMGIYEDEWYQVTNAHIKALCNPAVALPANAGLYNSTDPYGTRLDLRMQFHDAMAGHYYRWSIRPHGETDWVPISTPISHRYIEWSGGSWVIKSESLGPTTAGPGSETGIYKVPDPTKAWLSNRNDLAYAIWNTAIWDGAKYVKQVPDGKYDLMLEIFDNAGHKVTPAAAGFKFILPTAAVGVVDDALFVEAGGELIMHLHVDNRDTVAEISNVSLNGIPTGECQFLEYMDKNNDTVEVEYVAYHPASPENFLNYYSLTISRGVSGTTVKAKTSSTPERLPVQEPTKVIDLLGGYSQCAFSIWLHTYPRTRDGHSPIRAYEDSDRSAFALLPK